MKGFIRYTFYISLTFCAGGPSASTKEDLARSTAAAKRLANNMKSRHPGNFGKKPPVESIEDPEEEDSDEESSEDFELWRLLPQLRDLPQSLLKKLPMDAMFQLNTALSKEKKSTEKLGVNTKLAHNAKKLAKNPVVLGKGRDNRREVLHPARFLGGACSSLADQWAEARRSIGEAGVTALGNYDLDAVGCGGCVTPKGWLEIHNPASQELKLKLFHMPNMGGSSSKKQEGESGGESLKEIGDLDSFKIALNTAREAMASALPWNRSISALVGLMLNTNYLSEDLGGNPKRAAILTEFADYVFGRNGLNWENSQTFLTTDELGHVWGNWRTKRGISGKSQEKQQKKEVTGVDKKKLLAEVCRLFNSKACKFQADKECKSAWGKTLKHVCNKFVGGGKVCLKEHSRMDHQ